jgi:hypothetical protein
MKYGLAGFGVFGPVGAHQVHADGSGKAQIKTSRNLVLSPDLYAGFLQIFLQFKGISMNRYFHVPDGMAAGQVAHRVSHQKEDDLRLAGGFAQQAQGVLLVD